MIGLVARNLALVLYVNNIGTYASLIFGLESKDCNHVISDATRGSALYSTTLDHATTFFFEDVYDTKLSIR